MKIMKMIKSKSTIKSTSGSAAQLLWSSSYS